MPPRSIEADRDLVMKVARGEVRPETDPWVFEEDLLAFALAHLMTADRAWLEDLCKNDRAWLTAPQELRRNITENLSAWDRAKRAKKQG